jgi:hypothetical protein
MGDAKRWLELTAAARQELADAFVAASSIWEAPALEAEGDPAPGTWGGTFPGERPGAWTPREVAQHTVSGERGYIELIRAVLSGATHSFADAPDMEEYSPERRGFLAFQFTTAEEAVETLRLEAEGSDRTLGRLRRADLDLPFELPEGHVQILGAYGFEETGGVAGLVALLIVHHRDHAAQLRRAVASPTQDD